MKIYIAGKITGKLAYDLDFKQAENKLSRMGHTVINPCCLPLGFEHQEYMHICKAMIDVCEAVYLLKDWSESKGATMEYEYAMQKNKHIFTELF